ncbi:hypothetical protein DPEC_G00200310 [Dallia pectoralis]|uniref:Uncharacterized protein n=1 Tax=Dallia pectoralis TaxID=75939 RepID=A0ACC2G8Q1_DALPE|nr:hypothetical protein DPEC_G00200310 [Dallia pectoralis]
MISCLGLAWLTEDTHLRSDIPPALYPKAWMRICRTGQEGSLVLHQELTCRGPEDQWEDFKKVFKIKGCPVHTIRGKAVLSAVSEDGMSTAGAPASFSLDSTVPWHQRAMHRSRSLVGAYLHSTSIPPRPLANVVRLPSLAVNGRHRQTTTTPLSITEPSLFALGQPVVCKGFSHIRQPPVQKRPLPHYKSRDTSAGRNQSNSRPGYFHFSYPIGPNPRIVKPPSKSLALTTDQSELRPLVMQYRRAPQGDALTVRGRPCLSLPSKPPTPVAPMPARTQLHIFLPTEGVGEEEEVDNESVDEGFLEELDNKFTSLKIHQKAKIHVHPN